MDFNITAIILFLMILAWQVMMWKKIKLKKWQEYTLSAIMVALTGWLVYLTFLIDKNENFLEYYTGAYDFDFYKRIVKLLL